MSSLSSPSLNIIIVGAGIAGLTAAISLRRAGHNVRIFERSVLNNEVGAALQISSNASRGLLALGVDSDKGRFVTCKSTSRFNGTTLETFRQADTSFAEEKFGAPWFFAHRVDLHEELKRLATSDEGKGRPTVMYLKSEVVKYEPETGTIHLADGRTESGDLIIAADGVHSGAVETILGAPNPALPAAHYNFIYRFLILTSELAADPVTAQFLENKDGHFTFVLGEGKRIIWYPCRNNEVQNFGGIFWSDEQVDQEDWHMAIEPSALLETFKDFHPSILAMLRKAKEVKRWPLLYRASIPSWHKGKLVLIGDAAHPMLPHQGQGGAMAIEDAVALGITLTNFTSGALEERLQLFEKIRNNRASLMTIFSNYGQDDPVKLQAEAVAFSPIGEIPKTYPEFLEYNFGYDVVRDSVQAMERENPGWTLPETFFERKPGKGVYP